MLTRTLTGTVSWLYFAGRFGTDFPVRPRAYGPSQEGSFRACLLQAKKPLDFFDFPPITYPYMVSVPASIAELDGRFERNRGEYLHVCYDSQPKMVAVPIP
jgi:hypothetical protein